MSLEIALVFLIILLVITLFVLEVFPMDKIGFCTIGALILFGLVSPEEAISGFSNKAVITILCLMIIAASLEQNGVISWLARGLRTLKDWKLLFMAPAFMLISGSISAFISSTAVVIVFIKIITELADKYQVPKNKLLLPISYASILGGSCTLMGTSTNLIVNSIYMERSGEQLAFFEFTWLGVVFLLVAVGLITLFIRFLPEANGKKLKEEYEVDDFIATIELSPDSALIGKSVGETYLKERSLAVLKLYRDQKELSSFDEGTVLEAGDRLLLSCNLPFLMELKTNEEVIIASEGDQTGTLSDKEFNDDAEGNPSQAGHDVLVELMMLPGARYLGKTLSELRETMVKDATPIAIKKRKNLRYSEERVYSDNQGLTQLKVGDRVLLEIDKKRIEDFDLSDNVAILQQHEAPEKTPAAKRNTTLFILLLVISLAATGTISILTSSIFGCVALLLSGCIKLESAYKKINWQILFLLAGMIPLGIAMNNTGTDAWLSGHLRSVMEGTDPIFSIGILFLATLLLSSVVSNNATAIIMAPLAIALSNGMELPTRPFIYAVMFASNFSFFTPVGYQTNTIIYSMGIYKFKHFVIVGGAVSLVLWILATFLLNTLI